MGQADVKAPDTEAADGQTVAGNQVGLRRGPRPGIGLPIVVAVLEGDRIGMLAAPGIEHVVGISDRRPRVGPPIGQRVAGLVHLGVYGQSASRNGNVVHPQ